MANQFVNNLKSFDFNLDSKVEFITIVKEVLEIILENKYISFCLRLSLSKFQNLFLFF